MFLKHRRRLAWQRDLDRFYLTAQFDSGNDRDATSTQRDHRDTLNGNREERPSAQYELIRLYTISNRQPDEKGSEYEGLKDETPRMCTQI